MTSAHAASSLPAAGGEGLEMTGLGRSGARLAGGITAAGIAAILAAAAVAAASGEGSRRFLFAYLVAFAFVLSLSLGGLFFVVLQHLTRAGWSVAVRRVAELFAANLVLVAALALVVVVPVLAGDATLYPWADAARVDADHLLHAKAGYLNPIFFAGRAAVYFGVWLLLARYFLGRSTEQDHTGEPALTTRMERASAPAMIAFALTVSFAAFDFLMSLDPLWYSTIFGVYFFAGAAVAFFAALALAMMLAQRSGRLAQAITSEHYHDVGKLLFAFVFFWGYIAFSQFMLIWYANIPEETRWYAARFEGGWLAVTLVLLFGHFLLPFAGLLPRASKRKKTLLAFWAGLLLVMHYVDLFWLVAPNGGAGVRFGLVDLLVFVGLVSLWTAGVLWLARSRALLPVRDPRLGESLAFENL